jgi:aminoglycoside phosphotransferase (APT) family kinase protein
VGVDCEDTRAVEQAASSFASKLERWARAHLGPEAAVTAITRLPGHSGISFAFDVKVGAELERLVIRIPPEGVRRSGITDVLRPVPVLRLMESEGVPVPRVRWCEEDEQWFGVPYLIVDLVPGDTLGDIFESARQVPDAAPLFRQAVAALARIHAADWHAGLTGWDAPRPLAGEVDRYLPLLERSPIPEWVTVGHQLASALAASAPPDPDRGLVHNDYYSNNWMFERGTLTAVLDWEGAFIGAPLLDVGWLCMMYDPPSWSPAHRARIRWSPSVAFILDSYEEAAQTHPVNMAWYRAFAGYRLALLTAYYLDLHRRGRRHDPIWENLGESGGFLLRRAIELIGS